MIVCMTPPLVLMMILSPKKWFVCAKGPIRRLATDMLYGFIVVSATLNKYDCYFYLCHIKENIILPILESIKVILQTLFIDHFGRENSWYIVIRMIKYLNGEVKKLHYPIVLLLIIEFIDTFLTLYQGSRNTGHVKTYLIEVKPLKQTQKPKNPKDRPRII